MEDPDGVEDVTAETTDGKAPSLPFPDDPMLQALAEAAPSAEISTTPHASGGHFDEATVAREELTDFVAAASAFGYTSFLDLCAVDYYSRDPRFEVVIQLIAMDEKRRLGIRVGVPGQDPVLPSITPIFEGANYYEREAWDLFGLEFIGHPDLTRILMPDEWVGHPLRKDYSVGSVPVQFKEAHKPV